MKKVVRLTENKLRQMISETVKKVLKESADYEALYDEIQSVTNNIINYCGMAKMNDSISDDQTLMLIDKLSNLASELSDTAHELEEHMAWD